jgi:hypothetical protein
MNMHTLPPVIARYVEASNADAPERVAACFDAAATVHDDGHVHRGRDEIAAWARDYGTRYQAVIEPAALEGAGGRHSLRATVRGNFSGSPVTLHFHFELEGDAIVSLEITP